MSFGNCCRRFPHAAADFKHQGSFAPENCLRVKKLCFVGNGVTRKKLIEGPFLRGRDVSAAQHKAADMTVLELFNLFGREVSGHGGVPGRCI